MYNPKTSGLLSGGGLKLYKRRRNVARGFNLQHMPDIHLTDSTRVRKEIPDFDPALAESYTERELQLLSERILLLDPKPYPQDPYYLSCSQLRRRQKREIQVASGMPDPSIVSGLYWRTHPEGRGVHTDDQRAVNGSSFYKEGKGLLDESDQRCL